MGTYPLTSPRTRLQPSQMPPVRGSLPPSDPPDRAVSPPISRTRQWALMPLWQGCVSFVLLGAGPTFRAIIHLHGRRLVFSAEHGHCLSLALTSPDCLRTPVASRTLPLGRPRGSSYLLCSHMTSAFHPKLDPLIFQPWYLPQDSHTIHQWLSQSPAPHPEGFPWVLALFLPHPRPDHSAYTSPMQL